MLKKCEVCGLEKYFSLDVCRNCSNAVCVISDADMSPLDILKALVEDGWMKVEVKEGIKDNYDPLSDIKLSCRDFIERFCRVRQTKADELTTMTQSGL